MQKAMLVLVLALPWCGFQAGCAGEAAKRPNILFLVSEDNGRFLGCYGDPYAKTPNLDQLAKEGVRYTNAYSNAPVCAPSRSTLITGMYATSLGTQHMRSTYQIPAELRLYPELLREAGYYCANPGKKTDFNFTTTKRTVYDEGGDWTGRKPGQPFFVVFNTMTTHESSLHNTKVHGEYLKEEFKLPSYHPDVPEIRSNWVEYYHKITKMDADYGAILQRLEKEGLADDTIVFYFSDHAGILPRSKRFCLDSGLHVPFIMRFGKNFAHLAPAAPGTATDRLVSFVDLAPSLLSLAGLPIPETMQGRPFLGPTAEKMAAREYVFGFRNRMDESDDFMRTVRDKKYRYVRNYLPHRIPGMHINYLWQMPATKAWENAFKAGKCNAIQSAFWNEKPVEELYDEDADPYEVNNLAAVPEQQENLVRLRAALKEHLLSTRDTGFLPESDMLERAKGGPLRTMALDDQRYPLAKIFEAAELAAGREAKAVPALIALMNDTDAAVRYWAAVGCCIRKADAAPALEPLRKLAKDSSPAVRAAAAEALCVLGHVDEGLPLLIEACKSGDGVLATNALDALGEAAKPAGQALADNSLKLNEYAARKMEWLLEKWGVSRPDNKKRGKVE